MELGDEPERLGHTDAVFAIVSEARVPERLLETIARQVRPPRPRLAHQDYRLGWRVGSLHLHVVLDQAPPPGLVPHHPDSAEVDPAGQARETPFELASGFD